MTYTRKAVLGLAILFVCQVATSVVSYSMRLVLARSLSPVEYGLIYSVLAFYGFFGFASILGLTDALVQRMPRFKNTAEMKTAFITSVYTLLLITGIILVIVAVLAPWLSTSYFRNGLAIPMLILGGLFFFVTPAEMLMMSVFQGAGKLDWYGYLLLARSVVLLLVTLLFLHLGFGALAAMIGYVLTYLLVPLVYLPLLLRAYPDFGKAKATYDIRLLREMLAFGIPVMLMTILGFFLGSVDTFFITLYRPLTDVALYNVAFPTASLAWFISGVIYTGMLPIVSEMGAKNRVRLLADGIGSMYLYLLIAILPFTAILLLFPQIIINSLFGAQYIGAAFTMQLLVVGGLFYVLSSLNGSVLIGLGQPKLMMRSLLVAAVVNVIGDIVLIPWLGIAGSGVATLSAFIVLFWINVRYVRTQVSFRMPYARILRLFIVTIAFAACVYWLRSTLTLPLWWKIFVGIAGGAAVYAVLLFALRIVSIEELRDFKRRLQA